MEKQTSLEFSPGTKYNYSNSNYNVLAKIIEKVSGEKFTSYSKKFFNDLNMMETSFVERYMGVIPLIELIHILIGEEENGGKLQQ